MFNRDWNEKLEVITTEMLGIEWGNAILNDGLYLGIRNGAVYPIIPTGAVLPYTSKVMTGFKIEPDKKSRWMLKSNGSFLVPILHQFLCRNKSHPFINLKCSFIFLCHM